MKSVGLIHSFAYDFVRSHRSFVVLQKKDFTIDCISAVQRNMMKNCEIPGILPLHVEEVDFETQLYFDISSKKMLSKQLQYEPKTQDECIQIIEKILSVIADSERYLLDPNNFVIHPDFIFSDDETKGIFLLYIPAVNPIVNESISRQLQQIVYEMVVHVEQLEGTRIQQLLKIFQNDSDPLHVLHDRVIQLLQSADITEATPDFNTEDTTIFVPQKQGQQITPDFNDDDNSDPILDDSEDAGSGAMLKNDFQWHFIGYGAAALVSALLWRLYLMRMDPTLLYFAMGGTIVLFGLAYFADQKMRSKYHSTPADDPQMAAAYESDDYDALNYKEQSDAGTISRYTNLKIDEEDTVLPNKSVHSTTVLPDETVLLVDNDEDEQKIMNATLEIHKQDQVDHITLQQDRFVVGRDPQLTDYILDSHHCSRTHFEIKRDEDGFTIMDLGSSNGTRINEVVAAPYKPIRLKAEDVIEVTGVKMVFLTT